MVFSAWFYHLLKITLCSISSAKTRAVQTAVMIHDNDEHEENR